MGVGSVVQIGVRAVLREGARRGSLGVAALAVVTSACGGGQAAAPEGGAPPPVPVEMVTLAAEPVEQVGEFVGTVKSLSSTSVQPQAEGFLTQVLVASGTRVTAGTPLFVIDSASQQAAVASLEAQRVSRASEAVYARQQAERARALVDAGAVSRQAYDQAVAQQQTSDALLKAIEDQLRQQQAELAYYRVIAQTAGVVGDVPARIGDRVTRSTVLTTINDNARLEAHIGVPVQQAMQLRIGQPLRLVDDAGAALLSTRVTFVAASVDDATQTVLVKAPVDARAGQFRAEQFVRAQIVWSSQPGLTVPVLATQRINSQYFVFVADPTGDSFVARQRPVTLGPLVGSAYVVLGGLSPGDRLIMSGTQKIGDGAPVQTLPPSPGGQPSQSPPAGAP